MPALWWEQCRGLVVFVQRSSGYSWGHSWVSQSSQEVGKQPERGQCAACSERTVQWKIGKLFGLDGMPWSSFTNPMIETKPFKTNQRALWAWNNVNKFVSLLRITCHGRQVNNFCFNFHPSVFITNRSYVIRLKMLPIYWYNRLEADWRKQQTPSLLQNLGIKCVHHFEGHMAAWWAIFLSHFNLPCTISTSAYAHINVDFQGWQHPVPHYYLETCVYQEMTYLLSYTEITLTNRWAHIDRCTYCPKQM